MMPRSCWMALLVVVSTACSHGEESKGIVSHGAAGVQVQQQDEPTATVRWLKSTALDLPRTHPLTKRATGWVAPAGFNAAEGLSRQAMTVTLPDSASGPAHLSSTLRSDVWLEISSDDLTASSQGQLVDDALVFSDVQAGTDLVQLAGEDRFEELRVKRDTANVFEGRWRLRLGPALVEARVVDGRVMVRGRDGYVWFQSLPLWVVDGAGTRRGAVAEVQPSSDGFTLVVRADTAGMIPPLALDPSFTSGGVMTKARNSMSAVQLASGLVLISGPAPNDAELYDPSTNTSVAATGATFSLPQAALLADGRVMYIGNVYDPVAKTSTSYPLLDTFDVATMVVGLLDGTVLIAGGSTNNMNIFDPTTNTMTRLSPVLAGVCPRPPSARFGQLLAVVRDGGKVFMAGCSAGSANTGWADVIPGPGSTFADTTGPNVMGAQAVAYPPFGRMFVAGGTTDKSTASWDFSSGWFAGPSTSYVHTFGGRIVTERGMLVFGGGSPPTAFGEFFSFATYAFTPGPSLATARADFAVAPTGPSRWGVFGGSSTATIEIYTASKAGDACLTSATCDHELTCVDGACCTTSSCPAGSKCSYATGGGACLKDIGQACATGTQCGTGFCVEGVCCNTSCGSPATCIAAGAVGTCSKGNGQSCASAAECTSKFCVDGICCDGACTGSCEACSATKKGGGASGTCGVVAAGTDPDAECTPEASFPASCKADGFCDGAGKCRALAIAGTACGATTCASATVTGRICDGSGACTTSTTSCAPYACDGVACRTSCGADAECAPGLYCGLAGTCVTSKATGQACGDASQCGSGFCVDGVCCGSACAGQCEACGEKGSEGSCIAIHGAPRATRHACGGDPSSCGGTCDGTSVAACSYPPPGQACGKVCAVGTETKGACDGAGTCVMGAKHGCTPYVCADATQCRIDCAKDGDCVAGDKCVGGACVTGPSTCRDDLSSSVDADGRVTPCGLLLCQPSTGLCRTTCSANGDCAAGNVCSTSLKICEPVAPDDPSGGCAMADASSRTRGGAAMLALGTLGALGLWKRRRSVNACAVTRTL